MPILLTIIFHQSTLTVGDAGGIAGQAPFFGRERRWYVIIFIVQLPYMNKT
jgi:hypothetical protein